MGNVVFVLIISMFSLRPLNSPYIYVDTNSYAVLKIELVNDNTSRDLVFHFVRLSVPSGLQFMQCIRGMCYFSDSVMVNIPSGVIDTIQLDFFTGSEAGPLSAIYRVYDANSIQDKDSIVISGQVPVAEFSRGLFYKSGKLYAEGYTRIEVYSVKGRLVFSERLSSANVVIPLKLKKGVYIVRGFRGTEVYNLKIVEVE